ncbi:sensor histidine kinase [Mesoaciditoga sp.]
MKLLPFSKAESHTRLGNGMFIFLFSVVFAFEFLIYFFFLPPALLYFLVVIAFDAAFYVITILFVSHFVDEPILTLIGRVRKTSLTLKPSRKKGIKGEFGEILKEVDRLAETLKRERDGLLETYNEYRNIVESLEEGIIMTTANGEILMINHGAEKIFSTHRANWKGKNINEFFRFYEIIPGEIKKIISSKKTGKKLIIRQVSMEVRGKFNALYIFEDVTEVKNLENALSRAENLALLGKITASVAHEIKNPLASLKLSVQLLKKQLGSSNSEILETINVLDKEVRRLEERAKGFLEFSNPKYEFKALNVIEVVTEAVKLARIRARDRNIQITTNYSDENVVVLGDMNALNSAFLNVLVNAMDACEENGKINVKVKKEEKMVTISFTDNGKGISPDALDYIFEPFFTLKNGGTGLGMSIVKRVVTSHGGKVKVMSKKGEGTTVNLHIPLLGDDNG